MMKKQEITAFAIALYCLFALFSMAVAQQSIQTTTHLQNPQGRSYTSLNGNWNIIVDPFENGFYNHRYLPLENGYFKNKTPSNSFELIEYRFEKQNSLAVPGDWNTQRDEFFFYEGTIWYKRDFALKKQASKKYLLRFEAVNYKATVYVNGSAVGEHIGGFTPFEFDVTNFVKSGDNFVVVQVNNRREREQIPTVNTDWWNYGGITRPVNLIEVDSAFVKDYLVQFRSNNGGANTNKVNEGVIFGSLQLEGHSTNQKQVAKVSIPELSINQSIVFDSSGKGHFEVAAKPTLWHPENPKLYDVAIQFGQSIINDKIGFRTVAVEGEDILLNGEPLFLRGISIHEERPQGDGRMWSEADARATLRMAQELNCNFVRLAHYPHNENMVKIADEMGLLVWSEIPVYWTVLFEQEPVYQNAEARLYCQRLAREGVRGPDNASNRTKLASNAHETIYGRGL